MCHSAGRSPGRPPGIRESRERGIARVVPDCVVVTTDDGGAGSNANHGDIWGFWAGSPQRAGPRRTAAPWRPEEPAYTRGGSHAGRVPGRRAGARDAPPPREPVGGLPHRWISAARARSSASGSGCSSPASSWPAAPPTSSRSPCPRSTRRRRRSWWASPAPRPAASTSTTCWRASGSPRPTRTSRPRAPSWPR